MKSCNFTNQKFVCETCNYYTNKKSSYEKHISTIKHQKLCEKKSRIIITVQKLFECELCGKGFNARNSLWYHKKKCRVHNEVVDVSNVDNMDNTVVHLMKENGELKKLLNERSEEQRSIIKTIEKVQTDNSSIHSKILNAITEGKLGNTTTIHNNNQFNLNFFLNEQCKNAMNIGDFIDSLQLDQVDVEQTGRLGYVEGISRIFMNKLNELDMYSRPLHCTDLKRETLYIKEDDRWEKDNENKDKLQSIVEKVANKNYEQLPIWQQKNPNHLVTNTTECELFMDIACNILGGGNEQETLKFRSQIMRNVLKEVTLEKVS
jgi:bifunctional DNA-binding transcriptional regulator/antitoxin component of YhaV-PrlF toxin-antitoxin module